MPSRLINIPEGVRTTKERDLDKLIAKATKRNKSLVDLGSWKDEHNKMIQKQRSKDAVLVRFRRVFAANKVPKRHQSSALTVEDTKVVEKAERTNFDTLRSCFRSPVLYPVSFVST